MRSPQKMLLFQRTLSLVLMCLLFGACQNIHSSDETERYTIRLLVKFSPNVPDPANPVFLKNLSEDAGVILEYIRPMSGGAHVIGVRGPLDLQADEIIRRLSASDDILYVEQERLLRHQESAG
jgi:hypothetical protein